MPGPSFAVGAPSFREEGQPLRFVGRIRRGVVLAVGLTLLVGGTVALEPGRSSAVAPGPGPAVSTGERSADRSPLSIARRRIKHVIFIVQENRSFDSYFGTYP